jgi:hypothetical protein
MVENAINILFRHVLWRTADAQSKGPDVGSKDVDGVVELRASLLEKLLEFAVGTSSNTRETVKRTVRSPSVAISLKKLDR